jgi:dethiobiotin synthetase
MLNGFFITGTDTDVGKTLASSIITAVTDGYYWKPIQSGLADAPADAKTVQQLTGLSAERIYPSIYNLAASLSPDQAAAEENICIDLKHCLPHKFHSDQSRPLIIEGAGGVMVPLNEHLTMLDLMQQINLPIIVVARGGLGTLNHTLLTLNVLRQNNLCVHGVIFSGVLNPANQKTIERLGRVKTIWHIPYFANLTQETIHEWQAAHREKLLQDLIYAN